MLYSIEQGRWRTSSFFTLWFWESFMRSTSPHMARTILPLLLTFGIVLAGFSLIVIRQNNFHSFEQTMDLETRNLTAKKELGELIGSDLQRVATYFYKILVSADHDRQKMLLDSLKSTLVEVHTALNVLSDGGTLSRQLLLNLPDQDGPPLSITYSLKKPQPDNLEVQTLRPQLIVLEKKLEQTIKMTAMRNRLLNRPEGKLLQEAGLQLRLFARDIDLQLDRMTEDANKLAYEANLELLSLQNKTAAARKENQQVEILWVIATVLCVFGFIGMIFRQVLIAQRSLENTVEQLQQTERQLQESHAEVLALNLSLEEQVAERTRELELSERLWTDAFDSVTFAVFLHDQKGRIIKSNQAYLDLAECPVADVYGQFYWDVFPRREGALPGCIDAIQEDASECLPIQQDVTVDGQTFRSQSFAIFDDQEKYLYSVHYMENVTEREHHIERLKRFEQIMSTSTDLIAFYASDHVYLAVNEVYADYFGVNADAIIGRNVVDVIGSEHYECHIREYLDRCLTGERQSFQVWVDSARKGRRYLDVSLTPYIDDEGQTTGLVSRCRDITEKQEREARLRLSAEVFESTTEGITITDKNGNILAVNQAFYSITGYTEAEVLGKNPRLLKSGRHDNSFYREMWDSLAENGMWRGEIWNKNKAGKVYPELLTITSVLDDQGETINYVAVFSDISALKQAAERLEYQAHYHSLTGLPNRLLLYARLEHSLQQVKREKERGAVLFIDLDNFKKINDSLGHSAGDEVLKEVAVRLQEHSRQVDTVSHLSGDEFVIVLQSIGADYFAESRAQKLLESLQKPFMVGGHELYVSGSIGIARFSGDEDIESLLKNADTAMYKAKEDGKNCYQVYSESAEKR